MSRKILIAAALVLGTAYSFACGGDDATKNTNTMPTSTATMTATAPDTASAMPTATETASATTTASAEPPPKPKSLFERLGGKAAIEKVTDDFIAVVKDDKRINKFFAGVMKDKKKAEALRNSIVDFMCKATGGDCEYKGKDMKEAHKNMKLKDADFDAFVEDLTKALDKNSVGQTEKDELLGALGGMRGDVVTVATKPAASTTAKAAGSAAPKSSK